MFTVVYTAEAALSLAAIFYDSSRETIAYLADAHSVFSSAFELCFASFYATLAFFALATVLQNYFICRAFTLAGAFALQTLLGFLGTSWNYIVKRKYIFLGTSFLA